MLESARSRLLRNSPAWLLAIGLFAMAMQALGGIGLMPRLSVSGFQLEICTSKGISKAGVTPLSGQTSLPDSGHQDCCTLCAAGAPLVLADAAPGVPPAPTFRDILVAASSPRPAATAWLAHPPRGPPPA